MVLSTENIEAQNTSGSSSSTTYNVTLLEFMQSVLINLRNKAGSLNTLGQGASQNITNFMISWGHFEGGSVTNNASFNPLNTKQEETGSVNASASSEVQSYPNSATGVSATVDALTNGKYPNLYHALSTNDEEHLGFTAVAPTFGHVMASDIALELATWASGSATLSNTSQTYILNIMQGAGISNASIQNGNQENGNVGNSQTIIDQWGAVSLGQSYTGTTPPTNSWSSSDVIKVGLGILFLLIGAALFIKVQLPGSAIAKRIPSL